MNKEKMKEQAKKQLLELLKPDDTLLIFQSKVSKSGMSRSVTVLTSDLFNITYHIAKVLDWRYTNDHLIISGCGMDMHFYLAYTLASVLFPDGHQDLTGNGDNHCFKFKSIF